MRQHWKTMVGVAAAAALVIVAGAVSHAREQGPGGPGGPGGFMGRRGPGGPGGAGGPGMMLRGLDLTATQREQVRATFESHKGEFDAIATRMRTAREALRAVGENGAFDEGAVRAKHAEVAAVEADAAVLRAKVHSEVWALLTPEQQQKARELQQQRGQRRDQMRERFEQRRNQRQPRRG